MMKKKIVVVIVLLVVCLLPIILWFSCRRNDGDSNTVVAPIDVDTIFVLQIPVIEERVKEYRADRLLEYRVRFVNVDGKKYLEQVEESKEFVFNSYPISKADAQANVKPPDKRMVVVDRKGDIPEPAWAVGFALEQPLHVVALPCSALQILKRLQHNSKIEVNGCVYFDTGAFLVLKLEGDWNGSFAWVGEGVVSLGGYFELPEDTFEIYKIRWRLCGTNDVKTDIDSLLDVKLTRKLPLRAEQNTTEDNLQELRTRTDYIHSLRPLIVRNMITKIKDYPEEFRLQNAGKVYNTPKVQPDPQEERIEGRKRQLYLRDVILVDIDWDEIQFVPDSFLMVDYLASIDNKRDRNDIGESFCGITDESWQFISKCDFEELSKIPLLFLLVYYNDWLTEERVNKLSKASNRIKLIVEEVKKYGNDSPNKLDEIMTTVLSKLSDNERRDYFVKSLKLRNYVKESNNLSLQKLMPNDLPPPPGPPENMQDWVGRDGSVDHGVFLRLEDDPDRGKVLVILDADRIEVRLGFRYMTKETQRYITEMLEAQAEDAAEAQKNIDKPAQENKNTKQ